MEVKKDRERSMFCRGDAKETLKALVEKLRAPRVAPSAGGPSSLFSRRSRSVSTGDPTYELMVPAPSQGGASTSLQSGEADRREETDMVAMEVGEGSSRDKTSCVRLLSPNSKEARALIQFGRREIDPMLKHLVEPWFFPDMSRAKGEVVLARLGLVNGSFVVRFFNERLSLSLACNERVFHYRIFALNLNRQTCFFLESSITFKSVFDLVLHYRDTPSNVLPCKLLLAVCRHETCKRRASSPLCRSRTPIS